MRLLRFLYNLLYPVVLIALLPWLIHRMLRRGKYRHKFGQRFAIYSDRVRDRLSTGGWTWVHAVSVGEVLLAMKLIHRMRERDPSRRFVLSTTTSTGFAMANEHRSEWLEPIYNPLDFFLFTRRALDLIRPVQLVLVEAEVWPNLVCQARARGIPAVLVNARLSPRSESRFRAFRFITAPVFNQLQRICVQDPEDIDRWRSLGVSPDRLVRTGSIKFDDASVTPRQTRDFRPLLTQLGVTNETPILLAGSTHAGEEAAIARIFQNLRREFPTLFLIVVPRHVERSAEVQRELEDVGLTVARRTGLDDANARVDALLVDTTGELRDWYACATVAFVGKSLEGRGGQNPTEPINVGTAVVVGPHMQNFAALTRSLVAHGGIAQAADAAGIEATIARLLRSPDLRADLVAKGQSVIASHRGATDRTCEILEAEFATRAS